MAKLEVRILGDPVLRKKADEVPEITPELRRLIDDMFETMYAEEGVGLAAPQVGIPLRLMVMEIEGQLTTLIGGVFLCSQRR